MSNFTIEVMNLIMSAKDPEAALAAAIALVKEFVKAEGIVVEMVDDAVDKVCDLVDL